MGLLDSDDDYLKIEPPRATLGQLQLTNRLEMVRIDDDVLGVVKHLKGISPGFELLFDKRQQVFVLYHKDVTPQGQVIESLVGAYKSLDARLIELIERLDAQGRGHYDLVRELEKLDRAKDREMARRRLETVGPIAERLRHALRKDLGLEGNVVHMSGSRGTHKARQERKRRAKRKR